MSNSLPQGWVPCTLADIAAVNPKTVADESLIAGFVPMSHAPTSYHGELLFDEKLWGEIKKSYTNFQDGDVIFAKVTPCFENGKAAIVDDLPNGIGAGSSEFYVLRPHCSDISQKLLFALIKTHAFMQEGATNMTGAVGLRRVPKSFVETFPIALPPAAEQKEIADRLDKLLAQVEATQARLARIPDIIKRFRQSVLAAAVSGKLTEEWRQKNHTLNKISLTEIDSYWALQHLKIGKKRPTLNITKTFSLNETPVSEIPASWVNTHIGYVFDVYVGATPSRSVEDYWNGDVPWVSSSEVAFCRIDSTKEKITTLGLSKTSTNIHPPGTVMLAMIGQGKTRGQVAILDIDACHNQNTAALRVPDGFAISEYLYFYLTNRYEETRKIGGGNNQQALNKGFVQSMEFSLPPYDEQQEIVRRVEQLFAYADKIEQQANAAKERVDNLTQAILAKAFRGELTADWRAANPDLISGDNSAAALLARIQAERATAKPRKRASKPAISPTSSGVPQ